MILLFRYCSQYHLVSHYLFISSSTMLFYCRTVLNASSTSQKRNIMYTNSVSSSNMNLYLHMCKCMCICICYFLYDLFIMVIIVHILHYIFVSYINSPVCLVLPSTHSTLSLCSLIVYLYSQFSRRTYNIISLQYNTSTFLFSLFSSHLNLYISSTLLSPYFPYFPYFLISMPSVNTTHHHHPHLTTPS
ncbi:uncharacterized protein RJT20DRAFT_59037 [Scheffersomyces xylosifermentans]|uniref:uncharacterized protein n=1 Tax=Scheffersomyces xylosifermentans TaxID=1304137 RepID=UPI00315CF1C0